MQIVDLYRYTRPDGGVTVSPIKPDCEYTTAYRLIADENKVLTNGETQFLCIDVDSTEGWTEVDAPSDPTPASESHNLR